MRSIVGRYLEHSRIFCFGQGERERYFIGSADLMERNLDRRVEAMTPVKDRGAAATQLRQMLAIMRRDDRRAWTLGQDGEWTRVETTIEGEPTTDTFAVLMEDAAQSDDGMTGTRDGDLTGGALPPLEGSGPPKPAIPREVELKYLVRDLEALRAWLARDWGGALDGVEFGNERTVEVEDRYIDTAYGALEQAGFGARLRREDNGPVHGHRQVRVPRPSRRRR